MRISPAAYSNASDHEMVQHADWLRRLARALVKDQVLADDVSQQAMMEAIQKRRPVGR